MRRDHEEGHRPGQPALIVTYGNTNRKCRPLDREVVVVGRAPGCDLHLVSPEVAPIHCVIAHAADGWRIRDCTGRGSTRVNGHPVQEEVLRDGDMLQIGTFSFALQLPPECTTPIPAQNARPAAPAPAAAPPPASPDLDHLRRSRRNLVRLALNLRHRLQHAPADVGRPRPDADELDRREEQVNAMQREYESLLVQLEQAQQEITADRIALQARLEQAEREKAEAEARIREAWAQVEEQRGRPEQPAGPAADAAPDPNLTADSLARTARQLDVRSQELGHYARFLRRTREQLAEQEAHLARAREELLKGTRKSRESVPAPVPAPAPEQAPAQPPRSRGKIDTSRVRGEKAHGQDSGVRKARIRDRMARIQRIKENLAGSGDSPAPATTLSGLRRRNKLGRKAEADGE